MEKLTNILEYEFYVHKQLVEFHDKAMKRLHIKLEEVKDDDDVMEFMNLLKRDIAYKTMKTIDEEWNEVKQMKKNVR